MASSTRRTVIFDRMDEQLEAADQLFDIARQHGWEANSYRMLKSGDGFAVEKQDFIQGGRQVIWTRVYFSRNEQDALKKLDRARRGW